MAPLRACFPAYLWGGYFKTQGMTDHMTHHQVSLLICGEVILRQLLLSYSNDNDVCFPAYLWGGYFKTYPIAIKLSHLLRFPAYLWGGYFKTSICTQLSEM